jgi:hypothetical protein
MPPPPAQHDGVWVILHPVHLKRGIDPAAATALSLARSHEIVRSASGIALQMKDGSFRILKSRSTSPGGKAAPNPSKELTAELTPQGKLMVVRGNPSPMAESIMGSIRKSLKLKEPDKYDDNCERCGSWVQHKVVGAGGLPDAHMAPCGVVCEAVFVPSAHHHPHHSSAQCDLNTCSGGITNPYTIIREVYPDGSAYDRWGTFIAKLPPEGVTEYRKWRGFTVKVWV